MDDIREFSWRNLNVRRDKKYEWLVERFCPSDAGHDPIFRYIKDFMVFAAFVGFHYDKYVPLEASDTIPITLNTYSTDRKDYNIYLLALIRSKDPEILKNERLSEAVKIFEAYSNGGLQVIADWLESNATDPSGIDTLLQHIHTEIFDVSEEEQAGSNLDDLEF